MNLDAAFLATLPSLELRTDAVVQGVISGIHKGARQGQSVEFAEHKEYAPGDDLKHMDWKAYGKSDRHYVKRFEQETQARLLLMVDASGSMDYGPRGLTKFQVAATLAAALAFLMVRQQDQVGLVVFGGDGERTVPFGGGAGHLRQVLEALDQTTCGGRADMKALTSRVSDIARRRTFIATFSDFLDGDPGNGVRDLVALKRLGHDLSFFHVMDQDELTLPFQDPTEFTSMEGQGPGLQAHPLDLRDSYLSLMERFLEGTRACAADSGCDYDLVTDRDSLDLKLRRFADLRSRSQGRKGRG